MAILLSLETSAGGCSVALHEDGKLLASAEEPGAHSASSRLAVLINGVLRQHVVSSAQISAVAVSAGPGSYTGLRIGVATAKGFCYALNKPLISVNTLELMAYQVVSSVFFTTLRESGEREVLLCPMLDARRMEVYCLIADQKLEVKEMTSAKVITEESFNDWLATGPVLFFGNGAAKCKEMIRHPNALFLDGIEPKAAALGDLAFRKFERGAFEDLSSFEPFYLKDFVVKKPKVRI
jgi:tRNA threonylcarbamoyladenosine biosynthesis protein TsaB